MSWWSVADELAWALVALFAPGVAVGWAAGLRRVWLLAVAPGASLAVLGGGAVLLQMLGVAWSRPSAAVVTVVLALTVRGLRLALQRHWAVDRATTPGLGWTLAGLLVTVPLAALPIKRGMVDPGMPAQTWDTPFHVNAIRWILETGDGSSLHLGAVSTNPRVERFYPGGWHDVVALVVTDSIPAAVNVTAIVVAAVVWPLGLACLVAVTVPRNGFAPVVAMVVGSAFVAFPARMQSVGTLWPNAVAFALIPVALALTFRLTSMHRAVRVGADPGSRPAVAVALLGTLAGIGLCHPSGVLAYGVVAAPLWVATWLRAARRYRTATPVVRGVVVGLPAITLLGAAVLATSPLVRAVSAYERERVQGRLDAVVSVLTDAQLPMVLYGNAEGAAWIVALVALGAVTTFVLHRGRWLPASLVALLLMYTLTTAPYPPLQWLVGPWYSDPLRLGGMAVLTMAPLAALGVVGAGELARTVVRRLSTERSEPRADRSATGVTALALVVLVVSTGWLRADLRQWMYDLYYAEPEQRWGLITPPELDMLQRAADELPDDSVVLGSPFTGAPFMYGIAGHDVVFPHISGLWGPDEQLVATRLDAAAYDDDVCTALEASGATHLYVDSRPYWPENENQVRYESLLRPPEELPLGLELVDEGGSARLYEITSCG